MKKINLFSTLLALSLVILTGACSEDKLDEIDINPNNPQDVSINLLLAQTTVNVPVAVANTDLAWYSSVFVQHTAGVHAQMQSADRRAGNEDATFAQNSWNNIYAGVLTDLDLIIAKGSEGGDEAGRFHEVGIAKVLKAYTLAVATDAWGRVPFSQAGQGKENRKPAFDPQQQIYQAIQTLLTEAIAEFEKDAPNPGNSDLIFGGRSNYRDLWTKTAWSLKARYANRLSNIDPAGSANAALEAVANGFESNADNFTFSKFQPTAIGENPWFQESNDRSHHAVSESFVTTLTSLNDPRLQAMVAPAPNSGTIVGASNGTQTNDQANRAFSDVTTDVLNPTSPLPMMTYDELKFIEAEALLRLGRAPEATLAYQDGVRAAMQRQIGASTTAANAYIATLPAVVTLQAIILQKWIAFFYFQPIEAYNDWRRTGFPAFVAVHPISSPPLRFPYPQSEIDANGANVPSVQIYTDGVWWDDGTED